MSDSTVSCAVVDECAAFASELVVEGDGGGEAAEPGEDPGSDAGEGAGAVAFEGEQVFAGPEDRFNALADRGEVRSLPGLVFAAWPDDRGVEVLDAGLELTAGVALVTEQREVPVTAQAFKNPNSDRAPVDLWGTQLKRAGRASGLKNACSLNPQKY